MGNVLQIEVLDNPQQALNSYVAGIVDGEGCIRIVKCKENRYGNNLYHYRLAVYVTQKDYRIPLLLLKNYGGSFYVHPNYVRRGEKLYRWYLYSQKAKHFLEVILPYLVLKKEQAELGLEFIGSYPRYKHKTSERIKWCENAFEKMKNLKAAATTESLDAELEKLRSDSLNCKNDKFAELAEMTNRSLR